MVWISQANGIYLTQKKNLRHKMLPGKFEAYLLLWCGDGKRRRDGDNCFKAPLDFAKKMGLIVDDAYCEKGTFHWVSKPEAGPYGCRLILSPLASEETDE